MLNDIFTDAVIQNVKKTKLIKTIELILERKIKWQKLKLILINHMSGLMTFWWQETLPYFIIFPNLWKLIVYCSNYEKNVTVMKSSIVTS